MHLHSFQELTNRIVHLSTRNGKTIPVKFSGDGAWTNTKTVNIPALPSGSVLTPNQFSIWLGYVLHEGPGHQTHTDLSLYEETCRRKKDSQFSYILNLLEDIRIENKDISLYPGDRKYLDAVHQFVDDKIHPNFCKNPKVMGKIYKELYVKYRHLDTKRIQGELEDKTLSSLLSEITLCQSTHDCINLAEKIINYLKQNEESSEKGETSSPAEGGLTDEENNEKDNEDKESSDENPKNLNDKTNGEANPDGNQANSSKPTAETSSKNSSNDKNLSPNGSDPGSSESTSNLNSQAETWENLTEIKNLLDELKNQYKDFDKKTTSDVKFSQDTFNKFIFPPENISYDKIYIPSEEDYQTYLTTRSSLNAEILSLKKMFRIYLQTRSKKQTIRGLEEGKLDPHRLHIASHSDLIFKDLTTKPFIETSIELMIDLSGSMEEHITRSSAILLAEALSSIPQIKLSISGFTTNRNGRRKLCDDPTIPANSGRQVGMDIKQFKSYNESYIKSRSKLGAIKTSGNTPLGDAYGKALEHILPQTTPRRIIFLITDGKPEFPQGINHSDYLLMEKIHKTAKQLQIETIGFGIGNHIDFLHNYFDQVAYVKTINELPIKLMTALKLVLK